MLKVEEIGRISCAAQTWCYSGDMHHTPVPDQVAVKLLRDDLAGIASEMFEALATEATTERSDPLLAQAREIQAGLRSVRGTALPSDIADALLPSA